MELWNGESMLYTGGRLKGKERPPELLGVLHQT